jgi:hypothetical protein
MRGITSDYQQASGRIVWEVVSTGRREKGK